MQTTLVSSEESALRPSWQIARQLVIASKMIADESQNVSEKWDETYSRIWVLRG